MAKAEKSLKKEEGISKIAEGARLRGPLPKVGIRPTIDGRRKGVRESLEDQTMSMAKSVAKLISTLKHPDGSPVECVISDTGEGGTSST